MTTEHLEHFEQTVILSFCGSCGVLLPTGLSNEGGECPNCAHNTLPRENRIEGLFTESEARKLETC